MGSIQEGDLVEILRVVSSQAPLAPGTPIIVAGAPALTDGAAVQVVEGQSAAEVVVAVRPWSGRYLAGALIAGAILAEAVLLFMLYAPPPFPLWSIGLGVPAAFGLGALFGGWAHPVQLALSGRRACASQVEQAAHALFTTLGVSMTRDRSGILVYVSLLEARCVAVADVGVRQALGRERWEEMARAISASIREHGVREAGVAALAAAVETLGPDLAQALPRRADDTNELPDLAMEEGGQ